MSSAITVLSKSKCRNGEARLEEYEVSFERYYGGCALTSTGQVLIFRPFVENLLAEVEEVFAQNNQYIVYLTRDSTLCCSWLHKGKIVRTALLRQEVTLAAVSEGSHPYVLLRTKSGTLERTSLVPTGALEWHPLQGKLPTDVTYFTLLTLGSLNFIATLNKKNESLIYLIDRHLRLKAVDSVEKVVACAHYNGKFYFLKSKGEIYEWGETGYVLYDNNLLIREAYGNILISDQRSNSLTENGAYRYFTLEEYVKDMERQRCCYLELF